MNEKEVMNQLSGLECYFYYLQNGRNLGKELNPAEVEKMHDLIREACEMWHKMTGATID